MITASKRFDAASQTISGRVDRFSYSSMISLMSAAGYTDVSSFVREAVLSKCEGIAHEIAESMATRLANSHQRKYGAV